MVAASLLGALARISPAMQKKFIELSKQQKLDHAVLLTFPEKQRTHDGAGWAGHAEQG